MYGDAPNALPLHELETRFEIDAGHRYADGIGEDLSIDGCLHSVFGASKVAADVMVQEYGRYFGLRTACFRGGTITGPQHAAAELHGFLGYVMRCALEGREYTVFGYQGKQVRDAIHCHDLVQRVRLRVPARRAWPRSTTSAAAGTRTRRCWRRSRWRRRSPAASSTGAYDERNRIGDHIWWIGSNARFAGHYPDWRQEYDVRRILTELHEANTERWHA